MADEEMETLKALDEGFLKENAHKLRLYFARKDDWVADERGRIEGTLFPLYSSVIFLADAGVTPCVLYQ